jgi:hypothetical protein
LFYKINKKNYKFTICTVKEEEWEVHVLLI